MFIEECLKTIEKINRNIDEVVSTMDIFATSFQIANPNDSKELLFDLKEREK